jgi:hypothetical protein
LVTTQKPTISRRQRAYRRSHPCLLVHFPLLLALHVSFFGPVTDKSGFLVTANFGLQMRCNRSEPSRFFPWPSWHIMECEMPYSRLHWHDSGSGARLYSGRRYTFGIEVTPAAIIRRQTRFGLRSYIVRLLWIPSLSIELPHP